MADGTTVAAVIAGATAIAVACINTLSNRKTRAVADEAVEHLRGNGKGTLPVMAETLLLGQEQMAVALVEGLDGIRAQLLDHTEQDQAVQQQILDRLNRIERSPARPASYTSTMEHP